MRSIMILSVALALTPAPAWAGEKQTPLEAVNALADYVARPDADFKGGNALYKTAKQAIKDEAAAIKDAAARPAAKRYAEIQALVADKLRRDTLPTSAWLMGFFGASLLWGGFAFCVGVARKKGNSGGKGGG